MRIFRTPSTIDSSSNSVNSKVISQSWVIGIFSVFGTGMYRYRKLFGIWYLYRYRIQNHAISVFFPVFIKNIKNPY